MRNSLKMNDGDTVYPRWFVTTKTRPCEHLRFAMRCTGATRRRATADRRATGVGFGLAALLAAGAEALATLRMATRRIATLSRATRPIASAALIARGVAAVRVIAMGAIIIAVATIGAGAARAQQQGPGPLPPPPKFEVKRIPAVPHPGPPPIPVETIVQKFAANEDAEKKIYDDWDYVQDVRIEELSAPGPNGGGSFEVIGESRKQPDGTRVWRVLRPIQSTLKLTSFTMDDVQSIVEQPLFFLTSDEIPHYDFLYAGQTQLDQLAPYTFQVKPKEITPKRLFFEGLIYVDNVDLAVVETYGKIVSEFYENTSKLPFAMYDIYFQNLQGHYWFPTYVSSDAYLMQKDGSELHLRLVVKSSDFKPSGGAQGATPSSQAPTPSSSQQAAPAGAPAPSAPPPTGPAPGPPASK